MAASGGLKGSRVSLQQGGILKKKTTTKTNKQASICSIA